MVVLDKYNKCYLFTLISHYYLAKLKIEIRNREKINK